MIDKDSLPLDKPRRTPDHPTKSHVVKTRVDGKEKIIRFGEQGASTAGKPKEGESERMKQKRASFKARHAKNIAKGKSSPAYWANKVKWATGGSVSLEDLDEQYEGIKKPDFTLLESFRQLIKDLQARAEDSATQEFDPLRALGRSGAAGSLEDLYESYTGEKTPHAARAEAGAADPDRAKTAKMVFDSFKAAGFSDAQAKALTAEINREGSLNPAYLFGTHTDAANKATNVGMLSWQGDRANRLMSFMAERGLIDPSGRITPGQDALNAQAEYLRWEMENDPSYTRTRETFLANPEIDPETAHEILGKNFIRWRIDDPAYRGSGFDRISEGYDLLNMAQGYAEGGLAELAHKYAGGGFIQEERTDLPRIYSREPTVAESVEDWWADKIRRVSGDTPFPLDERESQRIAKRVANLLSYVPVSAGMMSGAQAKRDIEAGDYGSAALNAGTALLDVVPIAAATKGGVGAIKSAADDVTELAAKYMSPDDIGRFVADETGSLPGMGRGAGVTIADRGDNLFDVLVEGKPVGQLSLAEGPGFFFMDDAMLSPEFRRKGVGSAAYDLIEKRLGERLIPSPRGLSDDAVSFWRKRLSTMDPSERATTLEYYEDALGSMGTPQKLIEKYLDRISIPADPAIKRAEEVLGLLRSGRADEVTEEMLDMGDPVLNARMNEHLYRNYDLPMDYESRMARAAEMGALDEYHGTTTGSEMRYPRADFGSGTRKGAGFFTSSNPYVASSYADPSYGSVFPMMNTPPPSGLASVDVGGKLWSQIPADTLVQIGGKTRPVSSYAARFIDGDPVDFYRTDDIARGAAIEGDGGVVFKNMLDRSIHAPNPPGEPSVIREFQAKSSEPSTVTSRQDTRGMRSRFARFDPRLAHLRNLSAGVAAGAIGASQYDPDAVETTAARVRENKFASGGIVRYDPAAVDSVINKLREVNRG